MTKKLIIKEIATEHSLDVKQITIVIDAFLEKILKTLTRKEEVDIHNFGKFKIKELSARKGRNPATGATIDIPARSRMVFKSSKGVKALFS